MNGPNDSAARAAWWFANGWGTLCFLLFMASLGTAEYKYACSLLSVVLVLWIWFGARAHLPAGVSEKVVFPGSPVSQFPVWVGFGCLLVLAVAPLLTGSLKKYLAWVTALTGIRL